MVEVEVARGQEEVVEVEEVQVVVEQVAEAQEEEVQGEVVQVVVAVANVPQPVAQL